MSIQEFEKTIIELVEFMKSKYFGKYKGIVKEIDESRARIKALVPDVYDDKISPWALPSAPFAGPQHGFVTIPEENDGVWIEFEGGDPNKPIWSGGWWATDEMPSPASAKTRVFATTKNHKIIINDEDDEIKLSHADGAEIILTKDEIIFKIGDTKIVLSRQDVNINNGALKVKQ